MLSAVSVPYELVEKRLAGNTAGILMSKKAHADFTAKYGDVTLPKILNAVLEGNLHPGLHQPLRQLHRPQYPDGDAAGV